MKPLTKAQRVLLLQALRYGSVAIGGFGTAQHHRPAATLQRLGLLRFTWVPLPPGSFELDFLGVPPGCAIPGLRCQGWTLTKAGRRYAATFIAPKKRR